MSPPNLYSDQGVEVMLGSLAISFVPFLLYQQGSPIMNFSIVPFSIVPLYLHVAVMCWSKYFDKNIKRYNCETVYSIIVKNRTTFQAVGFLSIIPVYRFTIIPFLLNDDLFIFVIRIEQIVIFCTIDVIMIVIIS